MTEALPTPEPSRSVVPRLLLGLALLLAGAGAWMLGAPKDSLPPRRLSKNQPVNPSAVDPRDISANNSPTAARNPVDPANVVVANRIDLPRYSCALHASFDGARTWRQVTVPFPAGEEQPARCFAPDVAYSTDGTLHLSFVTLKGLGNSPSALWSLSSTDGGRTMSTPVRVSGPLAFQVQLTTDPRTAQRLYLTWLQAEEVGNLLFPTTNNPVVTSTSVDGGATWSGPVRVTPESRARAVAPSPAIGPDGTHYVLYLDLLDDRLDYAGAHEGRGGEPYSGTWALVLARSTDQGTTWQETVVEGAIVPTERFVVFLPPTPSLAIDAKSGRVYAAFTDGKLGDPDVQLWSSSDGGKTFGPPVRVNDTLPHDGRAQYMPRVDVAPNGRVDVVYYDRRSDRADRLNEVSLQSSFDHGRTFGTQLVLSDQPFNSKVGPGGERDLPDLGNRTALVSTERLALAVWTDTRAGTEITQKQDLASAVVEVPKPVHSTLGWLRYLGTAMLALGLASVLLVVRGRRKASVLAVPEIAADPSIVPHSAPPRPDVPETVAPPAEEPATTLVDHGPFDVTSPVSTTPVAPPLTQSREDPPPVPQPALTQPPEDPPPVTSPALTQPSEDPPPVTSPALTQPPENPPVAIVAPAGPAIPAVPAIAPVDASPFELPPPPLPAPADTTAADVHEAPVEESDEASSPDPADDPSAEPGPNDPEERQERGPAVSGIWNRGPLDPDRP